MYYAHAQSINIIFDYLYLIGSVYTNKNKFILVKETLISFNSKIVILPVLILLLLTRFWSEII